MSLIDQLDLRSDEVKAAEVLADAEARKNLALDKMWRWPQAPLFVQRRHIEVTIVADTSEFTHQMALARRLVSQTWNDYYSNYEWPTVQGGAIIWNPRTRWNMPENWPVYSLVLGLALLVGMLVGTWPWQ